MRIQRVNNSYPNNNVCFKTWNRVVCQASSEKVFNDGIKHCNTTWLFRPSAEYWSDLVSYLDQRFEKIPKVNTYIYGCSDGSDAYSFLFTLMSKLKPESVKRYLPIIAKDYDSDAIAKALKGELGINNDEINDINKFVDFNKYFEKKSDCKCEIVRNELGYEQFCGEPIYKINDSILKSVQYKQADITKDYINIEPNNSIVFVRNFWPYLEPKDRENLAHNLYNRLDGNSVLITGEFDGTLEDMRQGITHLRPFNIHDKGFNLAYCLLGEGFKSSPIETCFVKNN